MAGTVRIPAQACTHSYPMRARASALRCDISCCRRAAGSSLPPLPKLSVEARMSPPPPPSAPPLLALTVSCVGADEVLPVLMLPARTHTAGEGPILSWYSKGKHSQGHTTQRVHQKSHEGISQTACHTPVEFCGMSCPPDVALMAAFGSTLPASA